MVQLCIDSTIESLECQGQLMDVSRQPIQPSAGNGDKDPNILEVHVNFQRWSLPLLYCDTSGLSFTIED